MTYSQVVSQASYKVGDVTEGTCIHMWLRSVDDNNAATFEAICGQDDGSGKCMLCWENSVNEEGQLVLTYYCDDIDCLGAQKTRGKKSAGGSDCVLQYSFDGVEFFDVTPEEPEPNVRCYFRCLCCEQSKAKKPQARKSAKKSAKKSVKKKSKGKAKKRR